MVRRDLHEQNRHSWNAAMPAQHSHKRDQAAFFHAGGVSLFPDELELLGDLAGLSVAHLLCNDGEGTLSCANLGATATGVDISDEAIALARRLADEAGIAATFRRMDVYDWLEEAAREGRRFDRAFCSIGVMNWLSDLPAWARGATAVLRPGGRLVVVDYHPLIWTLDDEGQIAFPYFADGAHSAGLWGVGDYVGGAEGGLSPSGHLAGDAAFHNPQPSFDFRWTLGEVVTAIAGAGLRLDVLREYPHSNGGKVLAEMRALPGRRWTVPADRAPFPLMYGLAASKQE